MDKFNLFLNELNSTRNKTQHKAEAVAPEDIPKYQTQTWNFLTDFFWRVFKVKYDDLDLADRIDDDDLRKALLIAKEMIELGQNELSVVISKSIYIIASNCFEKPLNSIEHSRLSDVEDVADLSRKVHELFGAILAVGNKSWRDYNKFREIPPSSISIAPQGPPSVFYPLRSEDYKPPQTQQAKWVRDYVIVTILDWQERGFDPKTPDDHYVGSKGKKQYAKFFDWAQKQIEAKRKEASK